MIRLCMKLLRRALLVLTVCLFVFLFAMYGQEKRAIVPADCVNVHYLLADDPYRSAIQINPQGNEVAYLVKEPNLSTNTNDIALYVRALRVMPETASTLLIKDTDISQVTWLRGGKVLAFLGPYRGHIAVMQADVTTREIKPLFAFREDIVEYTISEAANVLAFATEVPLGKIGHLSHSAEEIASGYRIPYQEEIGAARKKRTLHIVRRGPSGIWGEVKDIAIQSPFSGIVRTALPYLLHFSLSLSPDGRKLAITYPEASNAVPPAWRQDPTIHGLLGMVQEIYVMVLYDMDSGKTTFPLRSPMIYSIPRWDHTSRTLIVNADPPMDSKWHQAELGRGIYFSPHMFSVNVDDGESHEITVHVPKIYEGPLFWADDGTLTLRVSQDTIAHYAEGGGTWHERESFRIPIQDFYRLAQIASDGVYLVSDSQSTSSPPALFSYELGRPAIETFAKLNPQFDHLVLAPVKPVEWTTSTGARIGGLLFEPPDYKEGHLYPLVIHTKLELGQFLCDTGDSHYPSFAPQPMANAGVMYLIRSWPAGAKPQEDVHSYPSGYPGGVAEAAFQMDVWNSAVKSLSAKGLIDPNRVGIIGFSRTGWYTEFILEHSSTPYRAATVTDNVDYGLGYYWLVHNEALNRVADAIYGGPPYSDSLSAWLKYSPSFNADKIKTPLLMEEMGSGHLYEDVNAPPIWLASHFELFTALNRLHRPVEMYYYPLENHQPDHPQARLASLQRNLDWFRYWLQGYERRDPQDKDQYVRWRHLGSEITKSQQPIPNDRGN
jgi:dipeptidyl aminopeptidase/acylaminoacyl peptidase